jgi:hypothetical protein
MVFFTEILDIPYWKVFSTGCLLVVRTAEGQSADSGLTSEIAKSQVFPYPPFLFQSLIVLLLLGLIVLVVRKLSALDDSIRRI